MSTVSKDSAVYRFLILIDGGAHPGLITWRCTFTAALTEVLKHACDNHALVPLLAQLTSPRVIPKAAEVRDQVSAIAPQIAKLMALDTEAARESLADIRTAALQMALLPARP